MEISAEGEWARRLEEYNAALPMLFIVSQGRLFKDGLPGAAEALIRGLRIAVRHAEGQKCERCWNYSKRVGEDADFPSVCERCAAAIKAIEASRTS